MPASSLSAAGCRRWCVPVPMPSWNCNASDWRRAVGWHQECSRRPNDGSWMVMEFIASNRWQEQDLMCAAGARGLGERLALVHAMPVAATMRLMDAAGIANAQLHAINSSVTASNLQRDAAHGLARRASQFAAWCRPATCRPASITAIFRSRT